MLLTHWLGGLSLHNGLTSDAFGRCHPWRDAATGYRSNPFRPPTRFGPARSSRMLPAEHHWVVHRRLA